MYRQLWQQLRMNVPEVQPRPPRLGFEMPGESTNKACDAPAEVVRGKARLCKESIFLGARVCVQVVMGYFVVQSMLLTH